MDFGQALRALKDGLCVQRAGWNGRGMWLALWKAGTYRFSSEALENCPPLVQAASAARAGSIDVGGSIVMRTADGSFVFGWLASQTDLLAEDWRVMEAEERV